MSQTSADSAVAYAAALLSHYGFELRGYSAQELVNLWLDKYQANWLRLGVIEALYQGRYKAVSVEQILAVWARRGQPIYRFNHEFERLISRKLPQSLTQWQEAITADLTQQYNLPPEAPCCNQITDGEDSLKAKIEEEIPTAIEEIPTAEVIDSQELAQNSPQLKPQLPESLPESSPSFTYNANWSRCQISKQPIDQFSPPPDSSGFYLKLKAVAQQQSP
ncbi:MAG: hypothetical protein F6K36_20850 [Symploca sp. SIO3C6]|uniref:Uncharacterized protein n=1 Tax=Symploca sp. SIO1C4 TaxID=2607765 RepID=A0A6B3NBA7_9CYAN|nr:hypothetical protein [Symploca sp. SIO3C6]NER30399.1 hypothetical protein [Symploca sp. SIO1C4]